jgi:hypothetical protein
MRCLKAPDNGSMVMVVEKTFRRVSCKDRLVA